MGRRCLRTTITQEFELVVNEGLLTEAEAAACNRAAHEASFLHNGAYPGLSLGIF